MLTSDADRAPMSPVVRPRIVFSANSIGLGVKLSTVPIIELEGDASSCKPVGRYVVRITFCVVL